MEDNILNIYEFFTRGTRNYFIYDNKYYYVDKSLKDGMQYHSFRISIDEYNKAYKNN